MCAGDRRAREELIALYLPLAYRLAGRYRNGPEPMDDLRQVAAVGLVKAVDRWDPNRGIELSSYAMPTILGELRRHFRDFSWGVRPPRSLQELSAAAVRAHDALEAENGRAPTAAEIARRLGCAEAAALEALGAATNRSLQSLEAAADVGKPIAFVEPEFERVEQRATIDRLTRILDARAREALRLRFDEDLMQAEIAARLDANQMQVSRMLRASLATLHVYARA